jgi:hypothetical protein
MFSAVKRATLLYPTGAGAPTPSHHLMALLTDPVGPPGFLLTVTICTVGHALHDSTCILGPGDHDFLVAESSFVYYRSLRADLSAKRLIDGVQSGEFVDRGLMREDVFARVIAGVRKSSFAAPFAQTILDNIARGPSGRTR